MAKMARMIGVGFVFAVTSVAGAQGGGTARVSVAPTSKLWIEGTSNVHDWKCETTTIDAAIDIDAPGGRLATAPRKMLKKVVVKVPVKSLKCGHGNMDDNMYKALKADENSEISYIMASSETLPNESKDVFTLRVVGKLTLAGAERTITMDIAATRLANGTIKAVGSVPVKMTAFGVKPPSVMFGAIHTGDEVKVKFELTVGPKVIAVAVAKE
jgi:polyisoprenoid-binding protein YceI